MPPEKEREREEKKKEKNKRMDPVLGRAVWQLAKTAAELEPSQVSFWLSHEGFPNPDGNHNQRREIVQSMEFADGSL